MPPAGGQSGAAPAIRQPAGRWESGVRVGPTVPGTGLRGAPSALASEREDLMADSGDEDVACELPHGNGRGGQAKVTDFYQNKKARFPSGDKARSSKTETGREHQHEAVGAVHVAAVLEEEPTPDSGTRPALPARDRLRKFVSSGIHAAGLLPACVWGSLCGHVRSMLFSSAHPPQSPGGSTPVVRATTVGPC